MKLGIVVGILLGIVILAISGAAVTVAAIQPLARQISSPSLTPVPAAISQTITSSIPFTFTLGRGAFCAAFQHSSERRQ